MEQRLASFLRDHLGATDIAVSDVEIVIGGYSRETYAANARFRLDGRNEELALIIRQDPPPASSVIDTDRQEEFVLMKALAETDVPVPRVLGVDRQAQWFERPALIMERVAGRTEAEPLFDDGSQECLARVACDFQEMLFRLHTVDWKKLPLDGLSVPTDWDVYIDGMIDDAERSYLESALEGSPVMAEVFAYLRRNKPQPAPFRLVHCDYQAGNFVYDEEGIRTIYDWELGHIGDPREDIGWHFFMRGFAEWDLLAIPDGDDAFFRRYEERTGVSLDLESVHFFQILRAMRVGQDFFPASRNFCEGRNNNLYLMYIIVNLAKAFDTNLKAMGI